MSAWVPSVCVPPEGVKELVHRGMKADRSRIRPYSIALAGSRSPEAAEFFRMILRDDTGQRFFPETKFYSAVGLANLGEAAGIEWLIANCNGPLPDVGPARPLGAVSGNMDQCCQAALRAISGEEKLITRADWEAWWKRVDKKSLPKAPIILNEVVYF